MLAWPSINWMMRMSTPSASSRQAPSCLRPSAQVDALKLLAVPVGAGAARLRLVAPAVKRDALVSFALAADERACSSEIRPDKPKTRRSAHHGRPERRLALLEAHAEDALAVLLRIHYADSADAAQ